MKTKIRTKVGENPLTNPKARRFLREQSLSIVQNALPKMKERLNKTEEPDPDPRRSTINVKKWITRVTYQHLNKDEVSYSVGIRATNTQAPTSYTAYRRLKTSPEGRNVRTTIFDTLHNKPLTREEVDEVKRMSRAVYESTRSLGYSSRQAKAAKELSLKQYKRLVAAKVKVDNIAFSRLFSSKNVIKPNKSKYSEHNYAQCLKVWDKHSGKYRYMAHSYPKQNNDGYYKSRVSVMSESLIDSLEVDNEGDWK